MEDIGLTKSSPENVYLKAYSASFSQSTGWELIPASHPQLLSRSASDFILTEPGGEGQFFSWQRAE